MMSKSKHQHPKDATAATPKMQLKNKITLALIFITALMPIVLAMGFYFYYQKNPPKNTRNYGTLIQPQLPIPENSLLKNQTKTPYDFAPEVNINLASSFKGKWLLIYMDTNRCQDACVRHLFALRQIRLSLGKEAGRLMPIWLKGDNDLNPSTHALYDNPPANIRFLQADVAVQNQLKAWLSSAKNGTANINNTDYINTNLSGLYLVDPMGHLMMHYPSIEAPLSIIKDLNQLLKWSRVG